MEKKEKNVINIILTCAILVLTLSIVTYLFSLRPWNQENNKSSEPSTEEAMSTDKNVDVTDALVGEILPTDNTAVSASLPEYKDPISIYRQFLLRGDLMKFYNLNASQLRYRLYDIDQNGISELFFVTPKELDSEGMVIGKLWLDKENHVRQYAFTSSYDNVLIGTVQMNGKTLEADYLERVINNNTLRFWFLFSPDSYANSDDLNILSGIESYPTGEYKTFGDNGYQIAEEEFTQFYHQVDTIIGSGSMFDSFDRTISYEELIGNDVPDPGFIDLTEHDDIIRWKLNTQFPSSRTLHLLPEDWRRDQPYDTVLYTLPIADDAEIHICALGGDVSGGIYTQHSMSIDEYIENYNSVLNEQNGRYFFRATDEEGNAYVAGFSHVRIQIKNGEIKSIMMNPVQWG